jgi:hypothetical protein
MMLLKNAKDVNSLIDAVDKCQGQVILRSMDGSEEFNLKSQLSRYIAIGRLCEDHGDEYEIFCLDRDDTAYMLQFFHELRKDV